MDSLINHYMTASEYGSFRNQTLLDKSRMRQNVSTYSLFTYLRKARCLPGKGTLVRVNPDSETLRQGSGTQLSCACVLALTSSHRCYFEVFPLHRILTDVTFVVTNFIWCMMSSYLYQSFFNTSVVKKK